MAEVYIIGCNEHAHRLVLRVVMQQQLQAKKDDHTVVTRSNWYC